MKRTALAFLIAQTMSSLLNGTQALAQAGIIESSNFRIQSDTTSTSSLNLEGPFMAQNTGLMVSIQKKNSTLERERTFYYADRPVFSRTIYLRQGPGEYEIKVFHCPQRVGTCSGSASFTVTNTDTKDESFLLPTPEIASDAPEVIELSKTITQGMTHDFEKSYAIHNWIIQNIAYDTANYYSGNYVNIRHDAVTILHVRQAVCEGYTNLNAALHRAVGIRAKSVAGSTISPINTSILGAAPSSEAAASSSSVSALGLTADSDCDHAWNEIFINGKWLAQDTTWDAGYINDETRKYVAFPQEKYLFPDPTEFLQTHRKCSEEKN